MQKRSDAFALTEGGVPAGGGFDRRWIGGYFLLAGILLTVGVVCTGLGLWKERPGEDIVLVDHVNPNTASLGSLIRLEGIGPVRAQAIIAYRESHAAGADPVFVCPQDLEAVRGIGPKTVEKMAPCLAFSTSTESHSP